LAPFSGEPAYTPSASFWTSTFPCGIPCASKGNEDSATAAAKATAKTRALMRITPSLRPMGCEIRDENVIRGSLFPGAGLGPAARLGRADEFEKKALRERVAGEVLGVPLHGDEPRLPGRFDGLRNAVGGDGRDGQSRRDVLDRLVVAAVHGRVLRPR